VLAESAVPLRVREDVGPTAAQHRPDLGCEEQLGARDDATATDGRLDLARVIVDVGRRGGSSEQGVLSLDRFPATLAVR
jgi:hypothetical protein